MKKLFKYYTENLSYNLEDGQEFKEASLEACKQAMAIYLEEETDEPIDRETFQLFADFSELCNGLTNCIEKHL